MYLNEMNMISSNTTLIAVHSPIQSMKTEETESFRPDQELEHVPKYMKFSPFIKRGYRVNYTCGQLLLSLFGWHNETVNVWTHLLPFVCILALIFSSSVAVQHYHERHEIAAYARDIEAQRVIIMRHNEVNSSHSDLTEHKDDLFQEIISSYLTPVSVINRNVNELLQLTIEDRLPIREKIAEAGQQVGEAGHQIEQLVSSLVNLTEQTEVEDKAQKLETIRLQVESYQNVLNYYSTELIEAIDQFSEQANPQSKWPIHLYLFCVSAALSTSVAYHLFYPLSPEFYKHLLDLDFAGVTFINIGSTFPVVIYSSTCNTAPVMTYLPVITVLNVGAFVLRIMGQIKNSPPVYGAIGILSMAPVLHILFIENYFDNFGDPFRFTPYLSTFLLSGFFLLGGLAMMIFECPERKAPGTFDYCGAGHQIWHVCSVIGMAIQLGVIWQLYHLRRLSQCPAGL